MNKHKDGVVVCTAISISHEYEPEYAALTMDDAISWVKEQYNHVTLNRIEWSTYAFGEGLYHGTPVSFKIRPIKIQPDMVQRLIR